MRLRIEFVGKKLNHIFKADAKTLISHRIMDILLLSRGIIISCSSK